MMTQEATLQDLDLIAPLFNAYRIFYKKESDLTGARKFLEERITNKESRIFFCIENNVACGFMQLYPSFSSVSMKRIWILNDLYVHEAFRNKSIATLLINQAKELAQQTGAKGLSLETASENLQAQKLYEKTGWEKSLDYFVYYLEV